MLVTAAARWRLGMAATAAKALALELAEATAAKALSEAGARGAETIRYSERHQAFALASWISDDAMRWS